MKPTTMILIFILIIIILIGTAIYLYKSNIFSKVPGGEDQPPPIPEAEESGGTEENPPSLPG
jgi:hypothetical protein